MKDDQRLFCCYSNEQIEGFTESFLLELTLSMIETMLVITNKLTMTEAIAFPKIDFVI